MNNKTVKFGVGREKPADQKYHQLELFMGDFSKPRWAKTGSFSPPAPSGGEHYGASTRAL